MPPAARAAVESSRSDFLRADRGHVRFSNDATTDSRARHFASWLCTKGYDQQSARGITDGLALDLIGAYLSWVKAGNSLPSNGTGPLSEQSLRNYVNAAAQCVTVLTEQPCIVLDPTTFQQKRVHMHPYIREQLAQRAAWSQPKKKKEPYTLDMFLALAGFLQSLRDATEAFLTVEHAVFDWTRLGLFTGSRVSEYAQTRLKAGIQYNTIPQIPDAGIWAGQPLAFIRADFTFYSDSHAIVPLSDIVQSHRLQRIVDVHIRFRFDKSPTNFSVRKFRTTNDPILDPVAAAVSCIHRADLLDIKEWEPIGVYYSSRRGSRFLRDYNVSKVMRQACMWAYPNPTHYMRVNIQSIVPHSNRITAAVSLKLGGASDEEIAFRLRWHVSSVPTYLRECFQQVGTLIQQTLEGAYRTSL
jgi:hypothetical protein